MAATHIKMGVLKVGRVEWDGKSSGQHLGLGTVQGKEKRLFKEAPSIQTLAGNSKNSLWVPSGSGYLSAPPGDIGRGLEHKVWGQGVGPGWRGKYGCQGRAAFRGLRLNETTTKG